MDYMKSASILFALTNRTRAIGVLKTDALG